MDNLSIYQLLPPAIGIALTLSFLGLYRWNRQPAALVFTIAYASGVTALILDVQRQTIDNIPLSFTIHFFYLSALSLIVIGLALMMKRRIPYAAILTVVSLAFAGVAVFWFLEPNINMRAVVMSFAPGTLYVLALTLIPRGATAKINHVLFWIIAAVALQNFLRGTAVLFVAGVSLSPETYADSALSGLLHVMGTLAGLSIAMCVFTAIWTDRLDDLQQQANTDKLSGLLNRRGLEMEAARCLVANAGSNRPVSLVLCDLDHFKQVNDRFGHAAGDRVIRGFGKVLQAAVPEGGVVGRIGGEEFCILLPGANQAMARLTAEAIRTGFAARLFRFGKEEQFFTASFGVAELQADETYEGLLARADAAIYRAKSKGRNRTVVVAAALEPEPQGSSVAEHG
ncbi:GGDEF domain-containing protein [Pseudohoeflea coraliihabitans]|uniref:diguanylate cyclase n=1 Tax=Pseudohoeflea coraliihabitans TaxID=2860393 RepID=A0ABS6WSJ6_9HYPH|nr:GGDEF domain-containing protein [Pseudohoeflea sp. DP4N28-3]MBW3098929.1 GGDEF domain-containing protein [Pseudohoeflea sp. DP4N28-3]